MLKIGDFVTAYGSGYWQLVDTKPKIADADYNGENRRWKKGEVIGTWAILKKAFTAKMTPRIDFSYEDISWLKPVSAEVLAEIEKYFAEHPDYKEKFEHIEIKLRPMITNCWLDLPEEREQEFRECLRKLPEKYTMDEFWKIAKKYRGYVSKPPTKYLLNLLAYPLDMDKKANLLYFGYELAKTEIESETV